MELEEPEDAIPSLRRELRCLARRLGRRDHVELAPPGELRESRKIHRAELDGRARESADDRARVVGIGQQPKPSEQVAHLERGADGRALVGGRAHEHGDLLRRDALLGHQALDLDRDGLGLRALGAAAPEADLASVLADHLLDPPAAGGHDGAGRPDDEVRAVARPQLDDLRSGVLALEVGQVLGAAATRAADRLVVVARGQHVAVLVAQQPQQRALGEAQLLELVDQYVPEALGQSLAHVRALVQ